MPAPVEGAAAELHAAREPLGAAAEAEARLRLALLVGERASANRF